MQITECGDGRNDFRGSKDAADAVLSLRKVGICGGVTIEAEKEIIISSPKLRKDKVERFISIVKSRQEAGVNIIVITEESENNLYENTLVSQLLIDEMKNIGINVRVMRNDEEHYAVIDGLLVWHGGMNLLGKEDAWDNLIRVKDRKAASELMIMAHEEMKEV